MATDGEREALFSPGLERPSATVRRRDGTELLTVRLDGYSIISEEVPLALSADGAWVAWYGGSPATVLVRRLPEGQAK